MIIRAIRLKNYKKFVDETVDLPEGLFGIIGDNGSGKTTLVEAVAWAIYGSTGSRGGRGMTKREGAAPKDDCRVELEFAMGSDSYRVVRALRGKRQSPYASLHVNGSPEVEGVSAVTSHLARRIGMDQTSFFASVFTKQKELDALSDLNPAKRRERILRLLRIDSIDAALKYARADRRDAESTVKGMLAASRDLGELEAELERLGSQEGEQDGAIGAAKASAGEARAATARAKKLRDAQESRSSSYRSLATKLAGLEEKITSSEEGAREREGEMRSLEEARKRLAEIKPRLRPLPAAKRKGTRLGRMRDRHLEKTSLEGQAAGIVEEIGRLEAEKAGASKRLKGLAGAERRLKSARAEERARAADVRKADREVSRRRGLVERLESDRGDLRAELGKVRKLGRGSRCPTCKRVIGDAMGPVTEGLRRKLAGATSGIRSENALIRGLRAERDGLDGKRAEAEAMAEGLDAEVRQMIKDRSARDGLASRISGERAKLARIRKDVGRLGRVAYDEAEHRRIGELLEKLGSLDTERASLDADARRIPSVKKAISGLKAKAAAAKRGRARAERDIRALGFDEEKYREARAAYDAAVAASHERDKELIEAEGALKAARAEISRVRDDIAEEAERKRKIRAEEGRIDSLRILDEALQRFKDELISILPINNFLS